MEHTQVIHDIQKSLLAMQDLSYRDFQVKLMPTVDKETVIGVRTPQLRSFAKAFGKTAEAGEFLAQLPHTYYEENNLHGMLLGQIRDYPEAITELNRFLPFVDNWATCDLLALPVLGKHLDQLIPEFENIGHESKSPRHELLTGEFICIDSSSHNRTLRPTIRIFLDRKESAPDSSTRYAQGLIRLLL